MNLRNPTWLDFGFFKECYSDWVVTESNPPILESHIWNWVSRWIHRNDEICLVGETDTPVGFVVYRRDEPHKVDVVNICVHPEHREKGHSNAIVKTLRDRLVSDGVTVAHFEAVSGPIADQVERGKYRKRGTVQGKTGTLVLGELTDSMNV